LCVVFTVLLLLFLLCVPVPRGQPCRQGLFNSYSGSRAVSGCARFQPSSRSDARKAQWPSYFGPGDAKADCAIISLFVVIIIIIIVVIMFIITVIVIII